MTARSARVAGEAARPDAARPGLLDGLAHRVILSHGWGRFALAVAAGALGALAMPPFGLFPLLVVSLTLAVWLIDGATVGGSLRRTLQSSAGLGWAWGFGYFTAGLWWLGAAFLVEADQFASREPVMTARSARVAGEAARPDAARPGLLDGLAHRVILSHGWGRFALAVAAGALGALAMPPFGLFPLLVVSLTLAVWLLSLIHI